MHRIDRLARSLAAPTLGLLRTAELHAAGVPWSSISRRIASGLWERPHHGVADITCQGWDWERRVVAAVLACPSGTLASHRTAAALHDLPGFGRHGRIEVTTPRPGRTRTLPYRVHSTVRPDPGVLLHGVPCTGAARTLVGLGSCVDDRSLARAAREALRRGLLAPGALHDPALDNLPGTVRAREAMVRQLSAALLRQESHLEGDVIDRLVRLDDLPPFTPQHAVEVRGRHLRIDLAWPELRVAVEVDGSRWHADHLAGLADAERQRLLETEGWTVLRVSAADLADRAAWTRFVQRLRTAIAVSLTAQERTSG